MGTGQCSSRIDRRAHHELGLLVPAATIFAKTVAQPIPLIFLSENCTILCPFANQVDYSNSVSDSSQDCVETVAHQSQR